MKDNIYDIDKETSEVINLLKVVCVLMVLYIHSSGNVVHQNITESFYFSEFKYFISSIVCTCAVPIFFVLSGLLLYRKPFLFKENLKKKIRTLLIPYILVNLMWIIIFFLAYQFSFSKQFIVNEDWIIQNWDIKKWISMWVGYPVYPMVFPLWFIRDLLILNTISKLIKYIVDCAPKLIFIVMSILWLINFQTNIFFLQYQALYFFTLGYYVIKYNINLEKIYKLKGIELLYLLIIISEYLLRDVYLHQFQIFIAVIFWIKIATKIKNTNFLLKISKYSFGIFLLHEWSLTIIKKLIFEILPITDFNLVIIYLFTPLILMVFLIIGLSFFRKYLNGVYKLLTGGR